MDLDADGVSVFEAQAPHGLISAVDGEVFPVVDTGQREDLIFACSELECGMTIGRERR